MTKRIFDIFFSLIGIIVLIPLFVVIILIIKIKDKGDIFYIQERIGKDKKPFKMFKFKTMRPESDKSGLLTIGGKDSRITKIGYYLRKYKLDELPQLFNVLIGNMSLVGPRPEVKKYVDLYSKEQSRILKVKPGITDYASIKYRDESNILAKSENPEETYINEIMPDKIKLNLSYIDKPGLITDIKIIFKTLFSLGG